MKKLILWSNSDNPITTLEEKYNCVQTELCTEDRHNNCVKEGKCFMYTPHCLRDMFKMAEIELDTFYDSIPISKRMRMRNEAEEKVSIKLKELFDKCKKYVLTLEEQG